MSRSRTRLWKSYEGAKRISKAALHRTPSSHFFIFGCQRSGTTHLEKLFRADPRSAVFSEFSLLSIAPNKTVWRPLPEVATLLKMQSGAYTVARSLLFSHRAKEAVDNVSLSSAIWIFRSAEDVVDSMVRKWGPDFKDVSEPVESNSEGNWELQHLWESICQEVIEAHGKASAMATDQGVKDSYALYWYYRNKDYFDSDMENDPRILLFEYEDMLNNPRGVTNALLRTQSINPPRFVFPLRTAARSRTNSNTISFSPQIKEKCDALYARLVEARNAR